MNHALKKPAGFKPGRMMTLKMADGGYRKGSKDGGRVTGPGGPVDDMVPAMYSNGEYVLPADTAKHIGYQKLDVIKDATHTPAAAQRMGFVPGLRDGGTLVINPDTGLPKQSSSRALSIIPAKSVAVTPTGPGQGFSPPSSIDPKTIYQPTNTSPSAGRGLALTDDTGRAATAGQPKPMMSPPTNPNFATGTSPEAAAYRAERAGAAPPQQAPTGAGGARDAINRVAGRGWSDFTGSTGQPSAIGSRIAQGVKGFTTSAAKLAGRVATPLAVGMEGVDVARVAMDPNATSIDPYTQAAQGAGRLGAAGAGAAAGAAAGTALIPIPVVGTALGGIAGGLAGYYGADKAIEAGRRMLGSDAAAPASRAPGLLPDQPAAQAARVPVKSATAPNPFGENAGTGRGYVNPPLADLPVTAPAGNVNATRQPNGVMAFSGENVSGPVSYTGTTGFKPGSFGVSTPGEPGDGRRVMEMNNRLADQMRADREGTGSGQPFVYRQEPGQDWQSRLDRRNAEVSAGANMKTGARDIANNRIKAMDAHDLQGERLANDLAQADMQNTTARMGQRATAAQASASNQLAQQRLGMEQATQGFQARGMQRLEAAQQALLDPKATPEQRKQAQSTLAALNGKTAADRMQTVNLPDTVDATGVKMSGGQALIRTREDGSVEQVPIGAQQAQAQALPEKGALVKGQTYPTPRGAARWDGAQFIPV